MSRSHRDDRPALIALGLVLFAVILIGLFETTARHYASREVIKYQTSYPENGNGGEYAPIVAGLREFDPREDTYAQWIMAAFAIMATFASVWAVLLLRDTLTATRDAVRSADDAVKVTRELGQVQVRAYVAIGNIAIQGLKVGQKPRISYRVKNVGLSPAIRYRHCSTWRLVDNIDTYKCSFGGPVWDGPAFDLFPGGSTEQNTDLPEADEEVISAIMSGEKHILFYGVAQYRTVFGKLCRVVFCSEVRPKLLEDGAGDMAPTDRHNRTN